MYESYFGPYIYNFLPNIYNRVNKKLPSLILASLVGADFLILIFQSI